MEPRSVKSGDCDGKPEDGLRQSAHEPWESANECRDCQRGAKVQLVHGARVPVAAGGPRGGHDGAASGPRVGAERRARKPHTRGCAETTSRGPRRGRGGNTPEPRLSANRGGSVKGRTRPHPGGTGPGNTRPRRARGPPGSCHAAARGLRRPSAGASRDSGDSGARSSGRRSPGRGTRSGSPSRPSTRCPPACNPVPPRRRSPCTRCR